MPLKLAAMQPYLFPYLGYFQLIRAVDVFVILDTVQYIKQGWINRNYLLCRGQRKLFTLSLIRAGSFRPINDQRILESPRNRKKILNRITESYQGAPHFREVYPLLERVIASEDPRLESCLWAGLQAVCDYLEIPTPLFPLSQVPLKSGTRGLDRLLALCRHFQATEYVNSIGGLSLYTPAGFDGEGVRLSFLKSRPVEYPQFDHPFVPRLSIIDLMMFNSRETLKALLTAYDLIEGKAGSEAGNDPH
jgi:hypothetical protein